MSEQQAWAIEQLVYRAAAYTDGARWEEFASLFSDDARLARPSSPGNPIVGREAILASCLARPARHTKHVLSNVIVDMLSPTRARVTSVATLYVGVGGEGAAPRKIQKIMIGGFDDEVVLTDRGWAFVSREGSIGLEMDAP